MSSKLYGGVPRIIYNGLLNKQKELKTFLAIKVGNNVRFLL